MTPLIKIKNHLISINAICKAALTPSGVTVGYYKYNNFGDLLTPYLFEYFGLTAMHCPNFKYASAIGVGSILHKLPANYGGFVLGSGLIEDTPLKLPNSTFLLVRGKKTCDLLELAPTMLIGDPGIIADSLFPEAKVLQKRYHIGVVPHYSDKESQELKGWLKKSSWLQKKINLINVQNSPRVVAKEICQCEVILSSSLHGLIFADSFGIPNIWVGINNKLIGNKFKFNDYYSCFSLSKDRFSLDELNRATDVYDLASVPEQGEIQSIKNNVKEAFSKFITLRE